MARNYKKNPLVVHKTGNQFFDSQAHGIGRADNKKVVRKKERINISCLKSPEDGKGEKPISNVHTLANRTSNKVRLDNLSFFSSWKRR